MKDGYKDTEIGVIPVDWEVTTIDNTCKITAGGTPSTKIDSYWEPFEVHWLSSGEVNKKIIYNTDKMISNDGLNNSSAKVIPKHSILVALAGQGKTRGTVAITEIELTTNQSVASIMMKKEVDAYFLYHNLDGRYEELRGMSTGSGGRGGLNLAIIKSIKFAKPPLKEQKKIADILSTADDKIDAIATQIEKAETLKKGLLQKLLSAGIGHSVFKDSELGRIPENWEVSSLNVCTLEMRGGAPFSPSDFTESGHFVLHKGNVVHGGKLIQRNVKYTSYQYADEHSANTVDNSFLITTLRDLVPSGPTIGLIVKITDDNKYVLAQGAYGFKLHKQLNEEFIVQYSNTEVYRKLMQSIAVGSTQIHIRTPEFLAINIPLPPIEEQKQIAEILSTADEKLEVLRAKKEKYETLKQGLMQKLLTGEVRVKV